MPEFETTIEIPVTVSYHYQPQEGDQLPTSEHFVAESVTIEEVCVGTTDISDQLQEVDCTTNGTILSDLEEKAIDDVKEGA